MLRYHDIETGVQRSSVQSPKYGIICAVRGHIHSTTKNLKTVFSVLNLTALILIRSYDYPFINNAHGGQLKSTGE